MTLSTTIEYINQALNFPGLTYQDISLYFDMAIAELNTTLHTAMPRVSEMLAIFRHFLLTEIKSIAVNLDSADSTIPEYSDAPAVSAQIKIYFNTTTNKYGVLKNGSYVYYDRAYGCITDADTGIITYYYTGISGDAHIWLKWMDDAEVENFDFNNYLPDDWMLLWMVPYVCFKYTCRDGGTAQTFAEEMQQGFQQLQETYDVPGEVYLPEYADKYAYTDLVRALAPNIDIRVPCRAIYERMKHTRGTRSTYGSMYDNGGFGI